jgi:hypothetical protein
MKLKNNVSHYANMGLKGIPKQEAEEEIKKCPEIIAYCKENFGKVACPDECPYYQKCFSLNWQDERGVFPIYPLNY